jgi:hypothetical protein
VLYANKAFGKIITDENGFKNNLDSKYLKKV